MNLTEIERLLCKYDFTTDNHQAHYSYGTAGFRFLHQEMPPIVVRATLAVCCSLGAPRAADQTAGTTTADQQATDTQETAQEHLGIMVTASHNTEEYNGLKVADIDGGMFADEAICTYVVNERCVAKLLGYCRTKLHGTAVRNTLHIGYDTRAHSPALACLVEHMAKACHVSVKNHGVVTTPLLHHAVKHANAGAGRTTLPALIPLRVTVNGALSMVAHSYQGLVATTTIQSPTTPNQILTVDGACGVGYEYVQKLAVMLNSSSMKTKFVVRNAPDSGPLNEQCGSEHVQKQQQPPVWYDDDVDTSYCCSLDGDADRIVFFSSQRDNSNNKTLSFTLLDGDKMACLIGNFLAAQLGALQLSNDVVSMGVVQTAYANGASTSYLRRQGVQTVLAKTGVKYVHAAAHEHFDVGVYFESNGHGTVLFGNRFFAAMQQCQPRTKTQRIALTRLCLLPALVNQAVGDSLSGMLLIDAILQIQGWSIEKWATSLYQDLASRQLKVQVHDRSLIQTNATENKCLEPATVQPELQAAMERYHGRAFVRPSGTENVVRIYAEAQTVDAADALAAVAAEIVHRLCGGIEDEGPSGRSKM